MMASIGLQKTKYNTTNCFMEQVPTQLSLKTGMLSLEIEEAKVAGWIMGCV